MAALELELPQLTQFLLAACTKTTDNHPPDTVQDQTEVGLIHTRPWMSKVDNARRTNILHRQLPALSSSGSDLGSSVAALTNISVATEGLRTSLDRSMVQRRLDIVEKKKPTSVGDKYPHQLDCILKAAGAEREEDLPEIWRQMANRKRNGEPLFSMLQTQVSKEAAYFEQPAMRVTVAHENALKFFTFDGDGIPSNIASGFLPFMMIPPGGTSNTATARQLKIEAAMLDYGIVLEGGRGIGLEDSREIRNMKAYFPLDWDEGTAQLYAFLSGFSATHGYYHQVTVEFLKALKLFVQNRSSFKHGFSELYGCRFGIIKFVHYFHLKMHRWYGRQWDPACKVSLPAPAFCADLNKWLDDSIVASWVPDTRGVPLFHGFHRNLDKCQGRIVCTPAPPLTPQNPNPPGMVPPGGRERERRADSKNISNRNQDDRVVGEVPLAKKIRARGNFAPVIQEMKAKGKPVPKNATGGDHCLSWHLRGKCKTDCVRIADHVAYKQTALEPLFQWCHEAYEWGAGRRPSHQSAVVSTPSWRTASAVTSIELSKPVTIIKDPISVTQFPTSTTPTPFSSDLGKNTSICDPILYAPPILFPPVFLGSPLNPMAAPFPSESPLDPTADSFHPTPSASIDMPPPRPAPSPEPQHDELNSTVPVQHDELAPPVIQHDELDDLIQASVLQFLSSDDWSQFVESARDPKSDWANDIGSLDHPAAELSSYYKEAGVPVVPTPESIPWN